MVIEGFIWLTDFVDKIECKHNVSIYDVESVFLGNPFCNYIQKGQVKGENLYRALGKTEAGRYLAVFFIYKMTRDVLVISARDMTEKERTQYEKSK